MAAVIERLFSRLTSLLVLDTSSEAIERNVALVRVLLGVGMLHRFIDILGYGMIDDDPAGMQAMAFTAACCAAMLTIGLLTPIALLGLFFFSVYPQFGPTLADQNMVQLAWCLWLLGAGRRWSVDGLLAGSGGGRLIEALYGLSVRPTADNLASVRAFVLVTYAGICFSAAAYHFDDAMWMRGNTLQLLMVTPYMSDLAEATAGLRDAAPELYHRSLQLALLVQTVFELFLLPLLFWRPGRAFVALQWLAFIGIRGLTMNLGYLCYVELCLWLLVYNYRPWGHNVLELSGRARTEAHPERAPGLLLRTATAVVFLFGAYNAYTLFHRSSPLLALESVPGFSFLYRAFGQDRVNVFNRNDMSMGATQLVLFEVDDTGRPVRTVPFMDHRGGRLAYLRNDYLYFDISLKFQRMHPQDKTAMAPLLVRRVGVLDAALQPERRDRSYVALALGQPFVPVHDFEGWGDTEFLGQIPFSIRGATADALEGASLVPAYALPPGHLGEERRRAASLRYADRLWQQGRLPRSRAAFD